MAATVTVAYGGQVKRIVVRQGIPAAELAETLKAALQTSRNVVGLEDKPRNTIYPISLLSLDPSVFPASSVFTVLLQVTGYENYNSVQGDEEDESEYDADQEEEEAAGAGTGAEDPPILEYIQQHTAFSRIPMDEILLVFRKAASEKGVIDRLTFEHSFEKVCRDAGDKQDKKILNLVANKVFDVFDKDGNGIVDHSEFVAGLSLLCHASSEDKIRAAFNLFDLDGDGYVTHEEMLRYMVSFFEVCFTLDGSMKNKFGSITAEQVGRATANHCFTKADVNKDGQISFEEFRDWCNSDDSVAKGVVGGYLDD
eukprot:g2286.t1